jgi:hypothetical protein
MDSTFHSGDCSYLLGFSVVGLLSGVFLVLFVKLLQTMWFGKMFAFDSNLETFVCEKINKMCVHITTIGWKEISLQWFFDVCRDCAWERSDNGKGHIRNKLL